MPYRANPSTKAELVDRLLDQTFTGDLRELATDPKLVTVKRPKPHVVALEIAGKPFLLTVHKPKTAESREAYRRAYQARLAAKAANRTKTQEGEGASKTKGGTGRY